MRAHARTYGGRMGYRVVAAGLLLLLLLRLLLLLPPGDYYDDVGDLARALDEFSLLDTFSRCRFGSSSSGGGVACDAFFPERYVVRAWVCVRGLAFSLACVSALVFCRLRIRVVRVPAVFLLLLLLLLSSSY
jgi:hypothetical protein